MNATVKVFSASVKINIALDFAIIIGIGIKTFIKGKFAKTTTVLFRDRSEYNSKNLSCGLVKTERGKAVLYKIVCKNLTNCGAYKNTVVYDIGKTIVCPDWLDNPKQECGNALHLSKSIPEALSYNNLCGGNRILKCVVDWKDINIYQKNISKFRCKKVKVVCEVDQDGNEIKQGEVK
jgi:hypothetical protein